MTKLTNIQQVISNIPSVEKIQHVQQQQAQTEQSRLVSQNQKAASAKGKKVEDAMPSDKVEISVKDDHQEKDREKGKKEEGDKKEGESDHNKQHIDIHV
ncbi:MAG: hypothetical protein HZA12_04675 [Nitrospirae bacterium]|nr:hypothetical protein [Nitrospirota bacterium]